ncbi:MAG TPA: DNA gyrase subunit A, partial [Anaerolineaceae bacterium]|nr:DNA gyrase subunit A [Anaerolineaceae bacterium]
EDLMQLIPGPDFPTGGIIVGSEGIRQAYSTGRGHLTMRGAATIEEIRDGRFAIIIREIPYQLNKTSLIERIAALHREGRLDSISDMRDESDRNGMRIVIELKRGTQPNRVLNQLYKYTPLQSTFGVQLLALVDSEPRMLTLKRALTHYLEHRQVVITRRTLFELDKAKKRAHILDGLLIAIANLDAVIKTIRESKDADVAKTNLMTRFNLTEIQAQAILDMQLRRLAALERQKIEDEYKALIETIAELEDILANPHKILEIIRTDLNEVAEKYGNDRRTHIVPDLELDLSDESLIQDEPVFVSITDRGYIKRVSDQAYRSQGRGGRGVIGQSMRGEDAVTFFVRANTLGTMLFFTNKGKVYSERVFELPEEARQGRGIPLVNIINLEADETITALLPVENFNDAKFFALATKLGRIKRVPMSDFASVRPSGLIAIRLNEGDELGWVKMTSGQDDLLLVTRKGKALRFHEKQVRPTGRTTMGVSGITLRGSDRVAALEVAEPDGYLFVLTEKGQGKRTPLEEYIPKTRGTLGVATINQDARAAIGEVAEACVVLAGEEVTMISRGGIVLRTKVDEISIQGRSTQGVKIMDLGEGDSIAAIARISREEVELSEQTHAASVAAGESAPRRSGRRAAPKEDADEPESELDDSETEDESSEEED